MQGKCALENAYHNSFHKIWPVTQTFIPCIVKPPKHETQGTVEKCPFYQNFMLSEQLGILRALNGPFTAFMLTDISFEMILC